MLTNEYHIKDHPGNVRVAFTETGDIVQDNSYYPFGMQIESLTYDPEPDNNNSYLYNGKELQTDFDIDWYDYGARFYDAQVGRWHAVDPLAEKRTWVSPYNYVQNNPLSRIDPNGALDEPIVDENGILVGYRVEAGQGPTQIAEDINKRAAAGEFKLDTKATHLDIVLSNPEKFANVENVGDVYDEEYTKLNMNEGDFLSVESIIEREAFNILNTNESITEMKAELNENKLKIDELNGELPALKQEVEWYTKGKEGELERTRQNSKSPSIERQFAGGGSTLGAGYAGYKEGQARAKYNKAKKTRDSLVNVNKKLFGQ